MIKSKSRPEEARKKAEARDRKSKIDSHNYSVTVDA